MSNNAVEGNYEQIIVDLLERVKRLEGAETFAGSLDEISPDMGDIRAGRFIALSAGQEPDDTDATGVIMDADGHVFGADTYNLYGLNLGALQFGFSNTTGKAYFCSGNAYIDIDGISGSDLLKWMIRQTASNDVYTRTGKLGMALAEGGGVIPNWELSYESPAGAELVTNGGAEDGDFTGWTKTTETNGAWSVSTADKYSGTYSFKWSSSALSSPCTGVLTSKRYSATAGQAYLFGGALGHLLGMDTSKIEIKWYDHASAGSLISTDLLATGSSGLPIIYSDAVFSAPTGALSYAIVLTTTDTAANGYVYFDAITATAVTVNQKLWLSDDGVDCSNGLYPQSAIMFYDQGVMTGGATKTLNTGQRYASYAIPTTTTVNNQASYTCMLQKGTYTLDLLYIKSSAGGQVDIFVDGVEVASNIEMYAAAATYNQVSSTASISVTYNGLHTIILKAGSKHASSSAYATYHTNIVMTRTGA